VSASFNSTQASSQRAATFPLAPWIRSFLDARRIDRGASDRTIEAYRRDLLQFAETLPQGLAPEKITPAHLQDYILKLSQEKQKPASIARKTSALRQFFKFCCLEKKLTENPAENLESPKQGQRLPKNLSNEDISALLAAADTGLAYAHDETASALRARDRAIVYLLYATGLRISELTGLTPHDVDLQLGYLRVKGKGGKERIAPFAPVAGEHLRHWIEEHRASLQPATDHVFINSRGLALTRQSVWKTLKELALQAGISTTLSPHKLRHSFATHLLQSGMNLRSLQMLLGHSDLSTTQIYAHVTPEHLKTAHKKYHPRGD
jgi:integrase/recombinase XerD